MVDFFAKFISSGIRKSATNLVAVLCLNCNFTREVVRNSHHVLHKAEVDVEKEAKEGDVSSLHLDRHVGEVNDLKQGPYFPVRFHSRPQFVLKFAKARLFALKNRDHSVESAHGKACENGLSEDQLLPD